LLLGAKGSQTELVLNALYFHTEHPPVIRYAAYEELRDTGMANAIPLYTRFHTRESPIVGTSLDYFTFRNLQLSTGRMMGLLGECVIGANVARKRHTGVGKKLMSSPETVFDLAGVYPLKMTIVGVLKPAGTPDDDAVFVDTRTAWIIEGLGHGHRALDDPNERDAILERKNGMITANASLRQYNEITLANVRDFHFHGDVGDFPLSAVIAVPPDDKYNTLLRGRYQESAADRQLVVPQTVLDDLLDTVLTIQNYVIAGMATLSVALVAVISLVFMLSQQLRSREFFTLWRMGASRGFVAALVASEIAIVFFSGSILAAAMAWLVQRHATELLLAFLAF